MKKVKKGLVVLMAILSISTIGNARALVDFSPTENIVACTGGEFVIYILDKTSLKVQKRIRLNEGIDGDCFYFSPDGKSFWYSDYDDNIYQLDTKTWNVIQTIDFRGEFYINNDRSEFVCLQSYQKKIKGVNLNTGKQMFTYKIDTDKKIADIGYTADNKGLFVMFKPEDNSSEEKKSFTYEEKKDWSIDKKLEMKAKFDGKTASYMIIDKMTGTVKSENTTWFSDFYNCQILSTSSGYYIATNSGVVFLDLKNNVTVLPIKSFADYFAYDYKNNKIVVLDDEELLIYDPANKQTKTIDLSNSKYADNGDYLYVKDGQYYFIFTNYAVGSASINGVTTETVPFY